MLGNVVYQETGTGLVTRLSSSFSSLADAFLLRLQYEKQSHSCSRKSGVTFRTASNAKLDESLGMRLDWSLVEWIYFYIWQIVSYNL